MDLKNAAELAYNVLRNNTPYAKQKKIISTCFLNKFKALNYKETIIARLALIDGFYSTNVNAKRYFGIEEIAEQLLKVASDDSKAKSIFISLKTQLMCIANLDIREKQLLLTATSTFHSK